MGVIRAVLLVLFLATLGVASKVLFPVEKVEVVGNRQLSQAQVQRITGLEVGKPWLWAWSSRLEGLARNPWVKTVRLERPALGELRIVMEERVSIANIQWNGTRYGLAEDGTFLPGAPKQLPVLIGKGSVATSDLISLIRAFPQAQSIRYDSSGYQVVGPNLNIWSSNVIGLQRLAKVSRIGRSDVKISQVGSERVASQSSNPDKPEKLYVYSWGVSARR